jgi:hypothetical protein
VQLQLLGRDRVRQRLRVYEISKVVGVRGLLLLLLLLP